MYFETVACDTVTPSFSSSPWILGAPQSGFARLVCRIRSRSSVPIAGRPPSASTLPCPVASKSLPVPADHGLRPHHMKELRQAVQSLDITPPEDLVHRSPLW